MKWVECLKKLTHRLRRHIEHEWGVTDASRSTIWWGPEGTSRWGKKPCFSTEFVTTNSQKVVLVCDERVSRGERAGVYKDKGKCQLIKFTLHHPLLTISGSISLFAYNWDLLSPCSLEPNAQNPSSPHRSALLTFFFYTSYRCIN